MFLERLHVLGERLSRATAIIGGYALLGLSLAICAEIILRRAAGVSLQGVDEIGGYVLAGVSAFGFAYTLLHKAHTRIDILIRSSGPRLQAAFNLAAALVLAGVAIFMAWRASATFARSYALGSVAATPLQTPIWIPQAVWLAGLVLFATIATFLAVRGLIGLFRGAEAANRILGPLSLSQEIEAELDHGRRETSV